MAIEFYAAESSNTIVCGLWFVVCCCCRALKFAITFGLPTISGCFY